MLNAKEKLNEYAAFARVGEYDVPIYEVFVVQHPDRELVYPSGKHSGFPEMGCTATMGFYYDLDDAIEAVEVNACDIHETMYDAAFVICRFPGLYNSVGREGRAYFVWNGETEGYEEKEEPRVFRHVAL